MSNLLIKGAHVLLDDYTVKEADIAVKDTEILSIGHIPADFKADRTVDGSNHFAAPGFVNGHTHASMTMLRSYGDDMELMDWLNNRIWPTEAKMVEKDIRVGGELALLEMIKTGTTAYADMYGPHMESIIEATIKAGIRGVIARGAIGLFPAGRQILEDNVKLFENYHGAGDGLITIMMGVHAPYTCPPEFCEYARELAVKHQIPIHIHMNETQAEIKQIQEQYGKRPFKYIEDTGLFELPAIAAHCVWLDDEDIAIMKKHNISAIHNPGSNMKLASGVSPVPRLLKEGIIVALGTDGASSNNNLDMLEEVRLAAMLHKVNELDPLAVPAKVALQLGTENGAKALLLDKVGKLAPGYKADIVLYDMNRADWCPRHDLVSLLVYSASSSSVDAVICDGKVIMEKGEVLTLDEERILHEAQETAMDLVNR
ncbi:5-methylthioadenosine/S-adenosylhomocysteine deaminase [Anaerovibrio lipolyticus DSM 3074]|uniref:5-methylthioadenosine/S-adenosylhomocysteine deaminase n=1 Tax=Anaerovibrio lipolyticus DSM 3074 TaxID=1120997 RepID=A0A1M6D5E3_9FIRM|nr:amidohydrolase [Anaerovibrio lipolyticus]SHI68486.1 5-methylthioadenosine/S-adenosylhomocysteine deaminase [Anaerovibrio lipolyticus DSM 3074]